MEGRFVFLHMMLHKSIPHVIQPFNSLTIFLQQRAWICYVGKLIHAYMLSAQGFKSYSLLWQICYFSPITFSMPSSLISSNIKGIWEGISPDLFVCPDVVRTICYFIFEEIVQITNVQILCSLIGKNSCKVDLGILF